MYSRTIEIIEQCRLPFYSISIKYFLDISEIVLCKKEHLQRLYIQFPPDHSARIYFQYMSFLPTPKYPLLNIMLNLLYCSHKSWELYSKGINTYSKQKKIHGNTQACWRLKNFYLCLLEKKEEREKHSHTKKSSHKYFEIAFYLRFNSKLLTKIL